MSPKKSTKKSVKKNSSKASKKSNKGMIIGVVVVLALVIFLVAIFILGGGPNYTQESIDELAQCLTNKGVVMYGTYWCPHCADTKKRFGSSFQYINYIECDPRGEDQQAEYCIEQGVDKYDTWRGFPDGGELISEPSLLELAEKAGCPVPVEAS